jgi:hypothetical protein
MSEVLIPGETPGFNAAVAMFEAEENPPEEKKEEKADEKPAGETSEPAEENAHQEAEILEPDVQDEIVEEEEKPKTHKVVPLTALHQEREKRRQAQAEVEFLRSQLNQQNQPMPAEQPTPTPAVSQFPKPEPQLEQFDSIADYTKAMTKWGMDQAKWEGEQAAIRQRMEEQDRATKQGIQRIEFEYNQKKLDAQDNPEWMEYVVNNPKLVTSDILGLMMSQSENFVEVGIWLGKHTDEAKRISSLSPNLMLKEIGKIEARLEYENAKPESKLKKEPTKVARPGPGQQTEIPKAEKKKLINSARTTEDWAGVFDKLGI